MTVSLVQNFFKQTVTTPWTVGTGNFYVSQKPSVTSGFLVISPNSESLREIVSFSAVGTDGGGDYVTVSARGLGATTEQAHGAGEKVYMNITAQHIEQIKQAIEDINNAGALNASTTTKGVARLTTAPNTSLGNPTITIATPAVVTLTAHGLTENDEIQFTTTGALPTGITPAATYYVIGTGLTANTFQFSATFGGPAVNTSGSQSGVHTLTRTTPRAVSDTDTRLPSPTAAQFINAVTGMIVMYAGDTAPTGFLLCDGSEYLISAQPALYSVIGIKYGLGTGTPLTANDVTNEFTLASHGFTDGQKLYFTAATLPAGISAGVEYFVISATTNIFKVSTTLGGSEVNFTTSGTVVEVYNNFKTPDLRGSTGIGKGQKTVPVLVPSTSVSINLLGTVTVVDIGNDVLTISASHGLATGDLIVLSGTVPAGLTANTQYYVFVTSATQFELYTTKESAVTRTGKVNITVATTGASLYTSGLFTVAKGLPKIFATGAAVVLSTSGTLPGGMTAGTYYIIRVSDTTFRLANSYINATTDNEPIALSTVGTGNHTATLTLTSRAVGEDGGEEAHQLTAAEIAGHSHPVRYSAVTSSNGYLHFLDASFDTNGSYLGLGSNEGITGPIGRNTGDTPHNNMQPFVVVNYIIKT